MVALAVLAVLRGGREGEIYNIGGNRSLPNLEVVKQVLELTGKPESLIQYVPDRPGHDRRYAIDATKIETELGWRASENFESGIEKTVKWYLDQRSWWQAILDRGYQAKRIGVG